MKLVVDASVGLKSVLREADSELAEGLLASREDLLIPDFWLNEATNALWVQVRRRLMTGDAARQGLAMLKSTLEPAATAAMDLHRPALDISLAVGLSPLDALYAAFALAIGADRVVAADRPFLAALRRHPDAAVASLPLHLHDWASGRTS